MTMSAKPTVSDVMAAAKREGRVLLQPRGGVGTYEGMRGLLTDIEQGGCADIMPVTVDSHTRLGRFDVATKCLENFPNRLNGFPVVSHGYQVMRQLNDACRKPLQIRHGSPDGRRLMAEAVAGGITSFEGGPIGYNLPYCADVSLEDSFASWAEIDELAGILTEMGHTVEREFFGSLTAVAVPPSIALACTFIEAVCASKKGVRAMSIAIPQGGNMVQDIAALEAIPILAQRYLPADCAVYSVLHQFMGIFPEDRPRADALIFSGALAGYFGKAQKIVCKTHLEAKGIPDTAAILDSLVLSRAGVTGRHVGLPLDRAPIDDERNAILRETQELLDPIVWETDVARAAIEAFHSGQMDIPFPANDAAKGDIFPLRDANGGLRFGSTGNLPFSKASIDRNNALLKTIPRQSHSTLVREAMMYFSNKEPIS
jgi:methylaspartate mutase epsilon subunit